MNECECQDCGLVFESDNEEVMCPRCHSGDIITYEGEDD